MKKRLNELSNLEDGWYDGEGLAPTNVALYIAEEVATEVVAAFPSVKYGLYPMFDGGVEMEMSTHTCDIDMEFGPGKQVEVRLETSVSEATLKFTWPTPVVVIVAMIEAFVRGA